MPKITKEEFIDAFCKRSELSGMSKTDIMSYFVALPCACGHDQCKGWALVANNAKSIAIHNEFYGPKEKYK